MKNIFFLLLAFLFSTLLTSCFDIVEEVDLNKNGSGKIKLTVNLSKSKTKVASLMKLDKVDGIKIPSEKEIRTEVNSVTSILKSTKGIRNVKSSLDFNNYIATLSCDFSDISALNTFVKTLSVKFKTELSSYSSYSYSEKNKTLSRAYKYNNEAKNVLKKVNPENQKSFDDAFYTSIYRFNESKVSKQNNPNAKVSSNKKAVMLRANVIDLMNGKTNLSNTIILN